MIQKTNQGCGIPMPDLSDSGLYVGGQIDFTRGLVRGQVKEKNNIIIFNFASNNGKKCYIYLVQRFLQEEFLVDPVSIHSVINPELFD